MEWNIGLQCGMKNVAYCGMEHGTLGSAVMWNVTLGGGKKYVDLGDLLQYGGTLLGKCGKEKSLVCNGTPGSSVERNTCAYAVNI